MVEQYMKYSLFILKILWFSDYTLLMWGKIPGSPTFPYCKWRKAWRGLGMRLQLWLFVFLFSAISKADVLLVTWAHNHVISSFFFVSGESRISCRYYIISASDHIEASLRLKMWVEVASKTFGGLSVGEAPSITLHEAFDWRLVNLLHCQNWLVTCK